MHLAIAMSGDNITTVLHAMDTHCVHYVMVDCEYGTKSLVISPNAKSGRVSELNSTYINK